MTAQQMQAVQKPLLINFFLLMTLVFVVSCSPTPIIQPYFVSSNAHSLMDTYRDLVSQTYTKSCNYDNRGNPGRIADTFGLYYCTFSAMPAKGYHTGIGGYATFQSWFYYTHNFPINTKAFRTAFNWGDRKIICPECRPTPIVNPFPDNRETNSYEVLLVPVASYQRSGSTPSTFIGLTENNPTDPLVSMAINASDVKKINDIFIEDNGGFMSGHLLTQYKNLSSSVGVVCEVVLKDGTNVNCYVFNNHDSGRIVWKVER